MTKEERNSICWQMRKDMERGYDFGVPAVRWQVLAVSADLKKALIKIPGHTPRFIGCRSYYSPSVYLMEPTEYPAHGVRHKEVMEVKRSNPLTKAALTDLMCKHGCEYTYEGMLEITSTSYCPKCCRNVGFWADHALSCESRLEATSEEELDLELRDLHAVRQPDQPTGGGGGQKGGEEGVGLNQWRFSNDRSN